MKKPVVDYREFRFSKLNDPKFSHLKLLIGWVVYFALYFITENLIPESSCHVIHSRLDDMIPFCEVFVIPYVLWFALVAGSLLYFLLYDIDSFKKLSIFIIITQLVAMIIYIAFPNMQDLRPEVFPRDNLLTKLVAFLYAFDTNTNVCPSLHVAYSLGIASTWLKYKGANWLFKTFIVLFVIVICMATCFIKQHSVIDAFVAIPVCILAEAIAFGKSYWLKKFKKA